ncbi:hypothetical protein LVJ94_16115 [Pendulispora rubella]|uniref:Cytochrome c domain-containing protein n=1 Tax=Pendulispora rubella TaxID=2741070 RepID=A0ABZ2LCU2_9BACT
MAEDVQFAERRARAAMARIMVCPPFMDWKTLLLTATLGIAGVSAMAACASGDDSGTSDKPDGGSKSPPPGGGGPPGSQPPPGGGDAGQSGDAGTETDGAVDPGSGGPFEGAPAYVKTTGKSSLSTGHANGVFGNRNPAGTGCLDCHNGGPKAKTSFLFGGTVYSDPQNEKPAKDVEVRLVVNGVATNTYSDEQGNFFFEGKPHAGGGHVGARDATGAMQMNSSPFNGNCNGCHNGGSQPRVHYP